MAAGLGAAAYFALKTEPPLGVALGGPAAVVVLAVAVAIWGRSRAGAIALVLAAFAAAGFGCAAARTHLVAAPVVPADMKPARVEGWVVDVVSTSAEHPRMLIAPTYVEGLRPDQVPARIRITARSGLIGPGMPIRVLALLSPPPPPASPGAYDFARDAFFRRIGGSGLALGAPQVISLAPPPLTFRIGLAVNQARWSLARRLVERMGPRTGGLAAALVSGQQAWLAEADIQAMRDSGLAHILSISGVHMAIVGGFVFAFLRLGVAAWPWMALRVPGKKVAAAGALAALLAYLVISGWPPPAQRSAITAGVAGLAVLLDRRALTLHSLAVAALVVLALQPEAVAQPGFQMSFAATAALLAMAETWRRPSREISVPLPIKLVQGMGEWLLAGLMVSFVAGLATGPFAIQHFNRVTVWGLPANLATEALNSLVIMPALALGTAAALFGPGQPFLGVADWGLDATLGVARAFAGAPHAVLTVASGPNWTLAASFLGLLFVCLWRGPLRWLGLPFFAAVSLVPHPPTPAIWIAPEGANAAVALAHEAIPLRKTQAFSVQLWGRRRGLDLPADPAAAAAPLFDCNRDACFPLAAAPVRLVTWQRRIPPSADALDALCRAGEVVVLRRGEGTSPACAGKLVLGERALAAGGAAELYHGPDGWTVVWAQTLRGTRPWSVRPQGDED
ncbi:MAG TPA: ComEC/Rec2 family competence protein [Caulobacteraceae bacterium]|nr:ComEC/Rec2 family competence protein [Caulobacteraceae bacterium]